MRREGVAEQVRVHARGVEAGLLSAALQDEESARARERSALRVEEQLRPVAPVEVRPPAREVAPDRLDGLASDRNDPFLVSLAEAADEALVERDRRPLERDGLGHAKAGAVEELHERAVAQVARLRP